MTEPACNDTTENACTNAKLRIIASDIQDGFPDLTTEQILFIYSAFNSALGRKD